eukprot:TRINITY_DN66345_c0_g1_i1.p1 TRINITY_DN66345_c0_g1~~TRINITY_DN66345_c0_g1_i1.p1  ORF type:complete len:373 (+),score=57.53 TRINITY_DN66345_c0_g1_i1:33-1151(+)
MHAHSSSRANTLFLRKSKCSMAESFVPVDRLTPDSLFGALLYFESKDGGSGDDTTSRSLSGKEADFSLSVEPDSKAIVAFYSHTRRGLRIEEKTSSLLQEVSSKRFHPGMLGPALRNVGIRKYAEVESWCADMGVETLDDMEELQDEDVFNDLVETVGLGKIEQQKIRRGLPKVVTFSHIWLDACCFPQRRIVEEGLRIGFNDLRQAIEHCDCLLVDLTSDYANQLWCIVEWVVWVKLKTISPVILGGSSSDAVRATFEKRDHHRWIESELARLDRIGKGDEMRAIIEGAKACGIDFNNVNMLKATLQDLGVPRRVDDISRWCEENGIDSVNDLTEVAGDDDIQEEMFNDLGFKKLERVRFKKAMQRLRQGH